MVIGHRHCTSNRGSSAQRAIRESGAITECWRVQVQSEMEFRFLNSIGTGDRYKTVAVYSSEWRNAEHSMGGEKRRLVLPILVWSTRNPVLLN